MTCYGHYGVLVCACTRDRHECSAKRGVYDRAQFIASLPNDEARSRELKIMALKSSRMAQAVRETAWTLIQENPGKQPPISNPNPQSRLSSVRQRTEAA